MISSLKQVAYFFFDFKALCYCWYVRSMHVFLCVPQYEEMASVGRRGWEEDYALKQAFPALVPAFDPRPGRSNISQIQNFEVPPPGIPGFQRGHRENFPPNESTSLLIIIISWEICPLEVICYYIIHVLTLVKCIVKLPLWTPNPGWNSVHLYMYTQHSIYMIFM